MADSYTGWTGWTGWTGRQGPRGNPGLDAGVILDTTETGDGGYEITLMSISGDRVVDQKGVTFYPPTGATGWTGKDGTGWTGWTGWTGKDGTGWTGWTGWTGSAALGTSDPKSDAVSASPGSSTLAAREDHVHPFSDSVVRVDSAMSMPGASTEAGKNNKFLPGHGIAFADQNGDTYLLRGSSYGSRVALETFDGHAGMYMKPQTNSPTGYVIGVGSNEVPAYFDGRQARIRNATNSDVFAEITVNNENNLYVNATASSPTGGIKLVAKKNGVVLNDTPDIALSSAYSTDKTVVTAGWVNTNLKDFTVNGNTGSKKSIVATENIDIAQKTLVAGSGITLSEQNNEITIASTGSGSASGMTVSELYVITGVTYNKSTKKITATKKKLSFSNGLLVALTNADSDEIQAVEETV